jgi:hypothetical protein
MESWEGTIGCATPVWHYVASMDWQQLVSLALVASAAVLLLGRNRRRRKFDFQRDTHCGCAGVSQSWPQASIVFHARKGARPEVRVKLR